MKSEKILWSSISLLIGAVIFILSLFRGAWQVGLLLTVFALWGGWVVKFLLMPYINQAKRRKMRRKQREQRFSQVLLQTEDVHPQKDIATETMMRHVNHRITAYIHSIYPGATWQWCEEHPEQIVIGGGIGRLKVFGVEDFTHADIKVDKNGSIRCSMVKSVPITDISASENETQPVPPNKQPVDPQIWYETNGRSVLEDVIADLNSRGHSSLILKENGEIIIEQDKQDVTAEQLTAFPAKVYWPRLMTVLQRDGLGAETLPKGIQVSW